MKFQKKKLVIFIILKYTNLNYQFYFTNRFIIFFVDKNFISISTDNVELNKVEILSVEEKMILFKNGKKLSNIKNEYGDNTFKIYYDNILIGEDGIFKTNRWHTHSYNFHVFRTDSIVKFNFDVKGPDSESIYYKYCFYDSLNRFSTNVFYDKTGKTGIVTIEYYSKEGFLLVDEWWENDTLKNISLYSIGELSNNYSINNCLDTSTFSINKCDSKDSFYKNKFGNHEKNVNFANENLIEMKNSIKYNNLKLYN